MPDSSVAPLKIPQQLEDLTPEWMTAALRGRGHLRDGAANAVRVEKFAEGVGLMSRLARVRVEYEGSAGELPRAFVVKIPSDLGPNRQMAVDYRLYEKEVFFYERLAGRVSFRTPRLFYSAFEPATHDFVLLLEDLSPAQPGNELVTPSDDQVRLAVGELAKFHAGWWDTEALRRLDWVPYLGDGMWRSHVGMYGACWPLYTERRAGQVSSYVLQTGEKLSRRIPEMLDLQSEPPCAIIHMDYRLPNLVYGTPEGGPEFTVVDWQPYSRARPLYDLGYFMSQSIPTELRRRLEDEVLHLYHDTLRENGVREYSFDQCHRDYRVGIVYTLLYPVCTAAVDLANEHGRAYAEAIALRSAAAIDDLRCGEVIPD